MLGEAARGIVQRALGPVAARMPDVSPNALTACGLGIAALAGLALAGTDERPELFLVAAALACLYGLVDALDGVLARVRGRVTAYGDFLDHSFDRLSSLAALAGLAWTEHGDDRIILVLMVGTLWHGFLGTQLEASFGRRIYQGIGLAEALLVGLAYTLAAYALRAYGLPLWFTVPAVGWRLSLTDAFALAAIPLVVTGTLQRYAIARALARERPGREVAP